jgi:hypothetical protein
MLRDCPIDHRCMTAVSAEAVYARAMRFIGAGGAAAEAVG